MSYFKFQNVGIRVLSATVPKNVVKTRELKEFPQDAIEKFIETTGVEYRRFADAETCTSDLCYTSACQIFDETDINREDIDVLIFASQTPDYKTPSTSAILQNRLGLNKSIITYDLNTACQGFLYSLFLADTMLQLPDIQNVMILAGDTLTKVVSPTDKSTGMLIGDGGIAAVISKGDIYGDTFFSMNTDGGNREMVYIPAGGGRIPSSAETMKPEVFEDGSIRSKEQLVMQGMDVFSYAITQLPKDVKKLLEFAGLSIDDIDKYAFHQSNKFMASFIAKKLKADMSKILTSIEKYGNTAGISIPLTLVENKEKINPNDVILANAIGAGFVFGSAIFNLAGCQMLEMKEF